MQIANRAHDEIEEIFQRLDVDGDGSVSFEEFTSLMLEMDHARLVPALRASFDAIDADHDGRVSFDEFRVWVSR